MELLGVLIPAIVVALVIRVDAVWAGPYFALSELVPGLPGFDAPLWSSRSALRLSVARRALYPAIMGAVLSLLGLSQFDIGLAGGLSAFLLLWPGLFRPLPWGVSLRDWRIFAVQFFMIIAFIGLALLGAIVIALIEALGDGDAWKYLVEHVLDTLVAGVLLLLGVAFTKGFYLSLKEKVDKRRNELYSQPPEHED